MDRDDRQDNGVSQETDERVLPCCRERKRGIVIGTGMGSWGWNGRDGRKSLVAAKLIRG